MSDSERIVASPDGNHFFTFRPDWNGPVPLPFRAAAGSVRLLPEKPEPKVLILGYGMGAVGALMHRERPETRIIGVEPERRLYQAAMESLNPNTQVHRTDALSFLNSTAQTFDLVFDDCFVVITDELDQEQPYRPIELEQIPALVAQRLRSGGIYVRNLLHQEDLPLSQQRAAIDACFARSEERTYRDWDNVLLVASDGTLDRELVAALGK